MLCVCVSDMIRKITVQRNVFGTHSTYEYDWLVHIGQYFVTFASFYHV